MAFGSWAVRRAVALHVVQGGLDLGIERNHRGSSPALATYTCLVSSRLRPVGASLCAALAAIAAGLGTPPSAGAVVTPSDPLYDENPFLDQIHWTPAAALRDRLTYPPIAIVDTGIDVQHEEFSGMIAPGSADCSRGRVRDATDTPTLVDDGSDHGTRVAGIAAAPVNGLGMVGVSPRSPLIAIRASRSSRRIRYLACSLSALVPLAELGPLVVNLSLTTFGSARERRALNALVRAGALVVAATGNSSQGTGIGFPAAASHVLAVGDVGLAQTIAGRQLDLLAPAGGIRVPSRGSYDVTTPATSWATPVVSGAAALVWASLPGVANPQVITYILRATADQGRWTRARGFGQVDLAKALGLARSGRIASDEFEPNDTPSLAFSSRTDPVTCPGSCTRERRGLAGRTDDAVDWWPVLAPGRSVRATVGGRPVRVRNLGSGRFAVEVRSGKPLSAYRVRITIS